MHGWGESDIPAFALALIIIIAVSIGFARQVTGRSYRKLRNRRRLIVEGEPTLAEAGAESAADHKSMLAISRTCSVCQNPSKNQCSRCKVVRYCSAECQGRHWKEGHKNVCRAPEPGDLARSVSDSGITCNGQLLEKSKNEDSVKYTISSNLGTSGSDFSHVPSDQPNPNGAEELSPSVALEPSCNQETSDGSLPRPKRVLFPYDYFVKLFNADLLSVPCGLLNCGNSCFANVVLQCLTYTRPVAAYLLEGGHSQDCRRNDWCFMCELQSHVWKVRQNQNPFSPIRILSRIRSIGNHLGYGRQEDAHEFMRFAIDSMQSICLDEVGGEKAVDPSTRETTLIHHIFGGYLQSQVKCMQCQHESNRYESMMDLAVEIHGNVESLEDAIAQFTTTELLDGDNKYKCDWCNAYVRARKQLAIHEAPNILTIALKRFQSGKFGKLNKRVTFPEVLDISPYMSGKGDSPPLYRLYAVVVHVDMLNASFFGHYICYVKDSSGVWYKIDDSKVKEVELDKVMAQRAYMLFYSRSVARKAPNVEHPDGLASAPTSTSRKNRLPVFIEPQRSSIFPPTLGATPVPTDLSKDYLIDRKAVIFETFEEKSETTEQGTSSQVDLLIEADHGFRVSSAASKDTDMEQTSMSMSEEDELLEESTSGDHMLGVSAIPCATSFFQIPGVIPSTGGNFEESDLLLDSLGDGLDRGAAKRTHEGFPPLPATRPLDTDQLLVIPVEGHGSSLPCSPVQGLGTLSATSDGDLLSSSVSFVPNNVCRSVVNTELWASVEAEIWKDDPCVRAKRQHREEYPEGMGFVGTCVDGDSHHMEIDDASECVDRIMNPQRSIEDVPIDFPERTPVPLDHDGKFGDDRLPRRSSKDLLELESIYSQSANHHNIVEHSVEMNNSASSLCIPRVGGPLSAASTSGDSVAVLKPPHQGRVLIEELPGLAADNDSYKEAVVENGQTLCTESYGELVMEDDTPYMIMEPICTEPAVDGNDGEISQRDVMAVESFKASISEMQEECETPADEAALVVEPLNQVLHCSEPEPINLVDVKSKKQTPKPLFAQGFLINSSKSRSTKPPCRQTDTINTNGLVSDSNGQVHNNQEDQNGSGEESETEILLKSKEVDSQRPISNGKLCSQVTSRTQSNRKNLSGKKPTMPASESGRGNGLSSPNVVDRAGGSKQKQGRNESCACGSQQKWKKCCGKASVLKGGLATKHVLL